MTPPAEILFDAPAGYSTLHTMAALQMNAGDQSMDLQRDAFRHALRTPKGLVAIRGAKRESRLSIQLDGPGADWIEPKLPAMLGLEDDLSGFEPGVLASLHRRLRGMRLTRQPVVYHRLIAIILQQLVRYRDACRHWRTILRKYGEEAPGQDLRAFPSAASLATLGDYDLIECGILPKQARLILTVAAKAERIEALARTDHAKLRAFLYSIRGIGSWTTEFFMGSCLGDADAVPLHDLHLPRNVAEVFGVDERADDDLMLRLLEPFRGHRFRVVWMITRESVYRKAQR